MASKIAKALLKVKPDRQNLDGISDVPVSNIAFIVIATIAICAAIARIITLDNPTKDRHNDDDEPSNTNHPPTRPNSIRDWFRFWCRQSIIANPHPNEEEHRVEEQVYWRETLRQQRCLNAITIGAAAIALFGLFIFELQLRASRHQLELSERSWISYSRPVETLSPLIFEVVRDPFDPHKTLPIVHIHVKVWLKNTGHSMAIVTPETTLTIVPNGPIDTSGLDCNAPPRFKGIGVPVAPGSEMPFETTESITNPTFPPNVPLYYAEITGCIAYSDAFGGHKTCGIQIFRSDNGQYGSFMRAAQQTVSGHFELVGVGNCAS